MCESVDPAAALRELFRSLSHRNEPGDAAHGHFFGNALAELTASNPELQALLARTRRGIEAAFATAVTRAQQAGTLTTAPAPNLVRHLLTLGNGLCLTRRLHPGQALEPAIELGLGVLR